MFGERQSEDRPTRFGQYQDNNLPLSLKGIPLDPEVLNFRRNVIDNPERLKELEADIAAKEAEASKLIGTIKPEDFLPEQKSFSAYGINQTNPNLREVDLSKFNIEIEDADTAILRRKAVNFLEDDKPLVVRLAGIDAPEVGEHTFGDPLEEVRINQEQLYGQEATTRLRHLINQQNNLRLIVDIKNKTYGRSVGAFLGDDNVNINVEAVKQGMVTALPFGQKAQDVVSRDVIAREEEQALQQGKGLWQYKRYRAARAASEAIGGPITYNTLTSLIKLSKNLNLATYESFLTKLGEREGALTAYEKQKATEIGRSLRRAYNPARFNRRKKAEDDARDFNGVVNSIDGDGYLQGEGLRHDGIAQYTRRALTDFGSGWKPSAGVIKGSIGQDIAEKIGGSLFSNKEAISTPKNIVRGFTRTIGSDDYLQSEGLRHGGFAQGVRQSLTDFGSGSRVAKHMSKFLRPNIIEKVRSIFGRASSNAPQKKLKKLLASSKIKYAETPEEFADLLGHEGKTREAVIEKVKKGIGFSVVRGEEKMMYSAPESAYKDWIKRRGLVSEDIAEDELSRMAKKAKYATELHETLEIKHSEGIAASVRGNLLGKGSHSTMKVIRDEKYLLEKTDPEAAGLIKRLRLSEAKINTGSADVSKEALLSEARKLREINSRYYSAVDATTKDKIADEYNEVLGLYQKKRYGQQLLEIYKPDGIHPGVEDSIGVRAIKEHTDFGSGSKVAKEMMEFLLPNSMKKAKGSFLKSIFSKSTSKEVREKLPGLYERFGVAKITTDDFLKRQDLMQEAPDLVSLLQKGHKGISPRAFTSAGVVVVPNAKSFVKPYAKALNLTRKEKKALGSFAEIHELLEAVHGRKTWETFNKPSFGTKEYTLAMKPKFGGHFSQDVIRDETMISKYLGGEFESIQKKLRRSEGVMLNESEENLKSIAFSSIQKTRGARTGYRQGEIKKADAFSEYTEGKYSYYQAKTAMIMKGYENTKRTARDSTANMDMSVGNILDATARKSERIDQAKALIAISEKTGVKQNLQTSIDLQSENNKTAVVEAAARKKRFYDLSKKSVAAGAKSGHKAAKRHSRFNSTISS